MKMSNILEPPTEAQSHGSGKNLWMNHGRVWDGAGKKETKGVSGTKPSLGLSRSTEGRATDHGES